MAEEPFTVSISTRAAQMLCDLSLGAILTTCLHCFPLNYVRIEREKAEPLERSPEGCHVWLAGVVAYFIPGKFKLIEPSRV